MEEDDTAQRKCRSFLVTPHPIMARRLREDAREAAEHGVCVCRPTKLHAQLHPRADAGGTRTVMSTALHRSALGGRHTSWLAAESRDAPAA